MKEGMIIIETIKNKIYTIKGKQVMIDSDLARLYGVETKVLNKAVKRNLDRFPKDFRFQLNEIEKRELTLNCNFQNKDLEGDSLRFQIGTLENGRGKHKKYLPYVFTEQGVAMLSAILRSEIAVKVSIEIMKAFVAMRKFIANNAEVFQRLDKVENKLLTYDKNFEQIFNALEDKTLPNKGIFFEGQVFDAYKFVSDLIRTAKESIILIDNYVDDSILILFTKTNIKITIYTNITKQLELDLKKYKEQYNNLEIKQFNKSHDRFLIIDNQVYHFGASLKDLGKKWFAFSKLEKDSVKILDKVSPRGNWAT